MAPRERIMDRIDKASPDQMLQYAWSNENGYFENHGVEVVGYEIPQLLRVHAADADEIGHIPLGGDTGLDWSVTLRQNLVMGACY